MRTKIKFAILSAGGKSGSSIAKKKCNFIEVKQGPFFPLKDKVKF